MGEDALSSPQSCSRSYHSICSWPDGSLIGCDWLYQTMTFTDNYMLKANGFFSGCCMLSMNLYWIISKYYYITTVEFPWDVDIPKLKLRPRWPFIRIFWTTSYLTRWNHGCPVGLSTNNYFLCRLMKVKRKFFWHTLIKSSTKSFFLVLYPLLLII